MKEKILYQPTSIDNINNNFTIVRACKDRFDHMLEFCQSYFSEPLSEKSFLDIGCNIGYFLNQFNKYCEKVVGIDYDNKLKKESDIFYPDITQNIFNVDYTKKLKDFEQFDIVSFMSLLHHIIISEGLESAIKVLKIVDEKTKEIMFFEMGQEHENFYKDKLPGWNIDKIKNFIIDNTSFNRCEILMVDSDSVGRFRNDFGRTLFAFYRDKE